MANNINAKHRADAGLNFVSQVTEFKWRSTLLRGLIVLSLAGCANQGGTSNETMGTATGAVLGGIAGSLVGKGNGRILTGLAGAAIGGFIGNRIGASLDERERADLAAQSRQALSAPVDNAPVNWKSDHSDSAATLTASNTRQETRTVSVVRDATVAPATDLDPIGSTYRARYATTIRLAPNGASGVVGPLANGERVEAVGRVRSAPWVMVARNGKAVGYVPTADVEPVPRPAPVATASAPAAATPAKSFDLDSQAPVRAAADLDALPPGTAVDKVAANVPCRDLKMTVSSKGESETSNQTACKSPDGTWELL